MVVQCTMYCAGCNAAQWLCSVVAAVVHLHTCGILHVHARLVVACSQQCGVGCWAPAGWLYIVAPVFLLFVVHRGNLAPSLCWQSLVLHVFNHPVLSQLQPAVQNHQSHAGRRTTHNNQQLNACTLEYVVVRS